MQYLQNLQSAQVVSLANLDMGLENMYDASLSNLDAEWGLQNLKGRFEGLPCDEQDAPIKEIEAKIRSLQQKEQMGIPEYKSGL